jgi:pyruvate,orthophosphate dikinase
VAVIRIGTGFKESPSAEEIGAKAAQLAEVAALGLPVPPAFVLPISLGTQFLEVTTKPNGP